MLLNFAFQDSSFILKFKLLIYNFVISFDVIFLFFSLQDSTKRIKTESDIMDSAEFSALFDCPSGGNGGGGSPVLSDNSGDENSFKIDIPGNDDSSNEALIVDCDSPSRPNSTCKFVLIIFEFLF